MIDSEKSKEVLRELTKLARCSRLSINELRVVLALERIVARIEAHKVLRDKLIFKGGFVLFKILKSGRFTRDLDALAICVVKEELVGQVRDALQKDLNDGISFAAAEVENFVDQGPYGGYRFGIPFQIGPLPSEKRKLNKLSRVHLDIGFGDVILGRAQRPRISHILSDDKPLSWSVYPLESIFAEKLETFIRRASGNSRAKDLYDLILLFEKLENRESLVLAVRQTFKNRNTAQPESLINFIEELDFSILKRSWGSVELSGVLMTFDDCRSRLKVVMQQLDTLFAVRS